MDLSKINLDPIFHSRVRLAIISILNNNESCSFTDIVSLIKAAAGNVSVQIKKLQEVGYIEVQKKSETIILILFARLPKLVQMRLKNTQRPSRNL